MTAQLPDSGKRVIRGALTTRWNGIYRNLPNIISILGVLPLGILLLDDGYAYLCALIVFNNIMDDQIGRASCRERV